MNRHLSATAACVAGLLFAMTSCDKKEVSPEEGLTISGGTTVEFNAEAESRQLEFSCTEQWFITYEPVEWLDVSPLSGEAGNVSVTLTVGMNETGEERSTSFTVISGSSNETVTVTQGIGNGNTDGMEFDPDFAEFLIANHDTDGDGILSVGEAAAVKSLEITDDICVLTSLRGIKNLVGLETLNCSYNSISGTLDLSGMTNLTEVRCDHNPILELDVSGCSSLKTLKANDMTGYILERLDLTGCTALEALECHDGNLSELDLSDCTSLKDINCCFNDLTEIDFTGCDRQVNVTRGTIRCTASRLTFQTGLTSSM